MPRTRQEAFDLVVETRKPSKCIRFLRCLWKILRCVFSHVSLVSLVVVYCVIGAYAFEALEAAHEKEVFLLLLGEQINNSLFCCKKGT